MNKQELIAKVAEDGDLTKKLVAKALDFIIGAISEELAAGGDVVLVGFGKFHTIECDARTGRNPRTGEAIEIPASCKARFSAGKTLAELVNQ